MICSDFNAKSPLWGQRPLDERGQILIDFMLSNDLYVKNLPNSIPTYSSTLG